VLAVLLNRSCAPRNGQLLAGLSSGAVRRLVLSNEFTQCGAARPFRCPCESMRRQMLVNDPLPFTVRTRIYA